MAINQYKNNKRKIIRERTEKGSVNKMLNMFNNKIDDLEFEDFDESCKKKSKRKTMKEYADELHGVITCNETGEEYGYNSYQDREYIISDLVEKGYTYKDRPVSTETGYFDESNHPYWMDDDVGFDIPDLDDRAIYGDEDFDESINNRKLNEFNDNTTNAELFRACMNIITDNYGNKFNTSLQNVTENIMSEFEDYINDEASNFVVDEIYEDGELDKEKYLDEFDNFITFNLRENDINEYDVDYMSENLDEARDNHTWGITYRDKSKRTKKHMVGASDAYDAKMKARKELGINFSDIDDVSMIENRNVRESMRKINSKRKFMRNIKESIRENSMKLKISEARHSELTPSYDSRKSFYGKAHVVTDDDGTQILYSYNTPVVEIKDNNVKLLAQWDSSQTTLRHVKEFLQQNGFSVGSKSQLAKMYGNTVESYRKIRKIH